MAEESSVCTLLRIASRRPVNITHAGRSAGFAAAGAALPLKRVAPAAVPVRLAPCYVPA